MQDEPLDFDDPIERRKWPARLVASAKGHARKVGRPFELTTEFIETVYGRKKGRFDVTGHQFNQRRFPDSLVNHPFAPSIDRRSSSGGYTKDNERLVCVAVTGPLQSSSALGIVATRKRLCHPVRMLARQRE